VTIRRVWKHASRCTQSVTGQQLMPPACASVREWRVKVCRRRAERGGPGFVRDTRSVIVSPGSHRRIFGFALSWSGGKDSALSLWKLRHEQREPAVLVTTVTESYDRISMHGVRRELLARQVEELGIPLVEVMIPPACSNDVYEQCIERAFAMPPLADIEAVAYGDLFLEDVRAYREERLSSAGRHGIFPIWGLDTTELARQFIGQGFEATLVCLDPRVLDPSFAGRSYDQELLADLPASVDPCGENGEFHTFVHAGPIFKRPIACKRGDTVERDNFVFCDLTLA